jgi:hypothetical protein
MDLAASRIGPVVTPISRRELMSAMMRSFRGNGFRRKCGPAQADNPSLRLC